MFAPPLRAALVVCSLLVPVAASAQFEDHTFLEGHVFDKRTGRPLSFAFVEVVDNFSLHPERVVFAEGFTDLNGFYQFVITVPWPSVAIDATCETRTGPIYGGSGANLREGTIRRDIYLGDGRKAVKACLSPYPF